MDNQQLKISKMAQCLQSLLDLIREEILLNVDFLPSQKRKQIMQMNEEILFLFQYAVNNTQAIIYLAKNDYSNSYSLVHSAFSITRVVIETNSKICWLLQPDDLIDRISRYIGFLTKEVSNIGQYKIVYKHFSKQQIKDLDLKALSLNEIIDLLTNEIIMELYVGMWMNLNVILSITKPLLGLEIILSFNSFTYFLNKLTRLTKLIESNKKIPKDFEIIQAIYKDEMDFLQFDYMILSKFIHSMSDVIYSLKNESQDLSDDWDTPFRVCFITLKICSNNLFDRFAVNSHNFRDKLSSIESEFANARG